MPIIQLELNSKGAISSLQKFDKAVDVSETNVETSFSKMRAGVNNFGKVAGVALAAAGAAVLALGIKSLDSASRMEEAQNKYDVVFDGMINKTDEWVAELRKNYALSELAAKDYLSSTKAIIDGTNMQSEAAGKLSNQVVLLAQDLASFHDKSPEQAVRAMTSAITGEYEAMKQFGVVIKKSEVIQEAMRQNNLKTKDSVTQAMEAQAAYALILQKSGKAQGDTIRSQASYAFQLKQTGALLEDLKVGLGTRLLPIATEWLTTLNAWVREEDGVNKVINFTIEAIRFLDNGIRGIILVAKGLTVIVAKGFEYVTEAVIALLKPIDLALQALVKLGVVGSNPLRNLRKLTQDFAAAQVEGFNATYDGIVKSNQMYDSLKNSVSSTTKVAERTGTVVEEQAEKARVANETKWKASVDNVAQSYDSVKTKAVEAANVSIAAANAVAQSWQNASGTVGYSFGTAPTASTPGGGYVDPNTGTSTSIKSSGGGVFVGSGGNTLAGSGPTIIGAPPTTPGQAGAGSNININITEKLSRSDVVNIIAEADRLEARA